MSEQRKLGVTPAGLGLTLFTCLLVALGYLVLRRLGDNTEPTPAVVAPGAPDETYRAVGTDLLGAPQIPPVQGTEPSPVPYPQTTLRPIWLAPQQDGDDTRWQRFDPTASEGDVGGQSLFDSQPVDPSQTPNVSTRY